MIDSDKCWANSDVSVMKKLLAKLLIMLPPLDKVAWRSPDSKWNSAAPRILIPIVGSLRSAAAAAEGLI